MIYKYISHENTYAPDQQEHIAEDLFNWEDPLFWVALFLYQKEINSADKLILKLRAEIKEKKALYDFLLSEGSEVKKVIELRRCEINQEEKKREKKK